jgi:hypothetical protein
LALCRALPRQIQWYYKKGLLPGRMVVGRLVFKRSDVRSFVKPVHPLNRWGKKPKAKASPSKTVTAKAKKKGGA